MKKIIQLMGWRPTSERADLLIASCFCYAVGLVVLLLGIFKITSMNISEQDLVFGVMLTVILMMQALLAGFMCDISRSIANNK